MPSLSERQIQILRDLRAEAGAAGDQEMVELCTRALDGDAGAWQEIQELLDD